MGMNVYTHIGIYLQFQPGQVENKETIWKSPKTGRVFTDGTKFCPLCGLALVSEIKTTMEEQCVSGYIDDESVPHLGEDEFMTPNDYKDVIIHNSRSDIPFASISVDGDSGPKVEDITGIDIPAIISLFKEEYKPYIDYFESQHGPCEVKYGALAYWS